MPSDIPLSGSLPSEPDLTPKRADRHKVMQFLDYLRSRNLIDAKSHSLFYSRAQSARKVGDLLSILDMLSPEAKSAVSDFAQRPSDHPFSNRKLWLIVDIVTVFAAIFLLAAVGKASTSAHEFATGLVVVAVMLIVARNIIFRRS